MELSDIFTGVLNERQFVKPSAVEALRKYASDPNIYITYVDHLKVGINPRSDFNTPIGVYAYPLKEVWNEVQYASVPFGGKRPYIYVLQDTGNMLDLMAYTPQQFEEDKAKLFTMFGARVAADYPEYGSTPEQVWTRFNERLIEITQPSRWLKNPYGMLIWALTKWMAIDDPRTTVVVWNSIFRALGYTGAVDREAQGIIHPAEPTQAVFFSTASFAVREMVLNIKEKKPEEDFD